MSMKEFIRQIFASATPFNFIQLYLGCFRGYLDNILQRHCGIIMMDVLNGGNCFLFGKSCFMVML